MIDLTPIVNAVITLLALLITTFLIPWIRTKVSNEKLEEVRKFLEGKGYKLDIETVDALIEATVREMQPLIDTWRGTRYILDRRCSYG